MKKLLTLSAALLTAAAMNAANTIQKVEQVTGTVTVAEDVDYIVNSATPFTTTGSVNITNTEHATLILSHVKPSVVKKNWLADFVKINGATAVDGTNCQVKMYGSGAIIMPYAKNIKPLTVYSEQNFQGTAVNSFGLENDGGYMNTLTDAKLNNRIRSFKLKRGYMVTFSTRAGGRGYSRCFIADKEDLEFATLPAILDRSITSYRIFKWNDAQKKGVASDTRAEYVGQVGGSWCYDWGTGHDMYPDIECVPNHIYEDWPSSSACGSVTYSCHMKTNNEPGNSADDRPQSVETVLGNWENLMRTGLRLCSESSHDGSMNHLKTFIEEIDKRGWRCDILDLHCYWPTGTFNNINWYIDEYGKGRPVWISEWVWGASWNNNGAFNVSDRGDFYGNQQNTYNGTVPILEALNANPRVERYAYWNSEANCSKIYRDAELSKLGEYYRDMESPIGYDKKYEYVPKCPPQYDPTGLVAKYDKDTKKVTLTWHEKNGEYNTSMTIKYRTTKTGAMKVLQEVTPQEQEADYEVTVDGVDGYYYQIEVVDANGVKRTTNETRAVADYISYGDPVTMQDGTQKYVGGNMFINGDFSMGLSDWTNGTGKPLAAPYFEAVKRGGVDGTPYLQCYGTSATTVAGANSEQAIKRVVPLEDGASYYVSICGMNNDEAAQKISQSTTETSTLEGGVLVKLGDNKEWTKYASTFTATTYKYLRILLRGLAGKAAFDEVMLAKLFDTKEEAMADAMTWEKKRAEVFVTYCMDPTVKAYLQNDIANATNANELEQAVQRAMKLYGSEAKETVAAAKNLSALEIPEVSTTLFAQLTTMSSATNTQEALQCVENISEILNNNGIPMEYNTTSIKDGAMTTSTTNWKATSTATGVINAWKTSVEGVTSSPCWQAQWDIPAGEKPDTMSVKQTIKELPAGFYALECKAGTYHYSYGVQNAFMKKNSEDYTKSQAIPAGMLDITAFPEEERWDEMMTPYMYLTPKDTLMVGFMGVKPEPQYAWDGYYMPYNNPTGEVKSYEGSFFVKGFKLRYMPYIVAVADVNGWGTIVSDRLITAPEGVTLYTVKGITADQRYIAVEPATQVQAGYPYIFKATPGQKVFFTVSGTAVTRLKNSNGLRGNVKWDIYSLYTTEELILQNGAWDKCITTGMKVPKEPNVASLKLSGTSSVPQLTTDWAGEKIPTRNVVEEEPDAVNRINGADVKAKATYKQATPDGIVIHHRGKIYNAVGVQKK